MTNEELAARIRSGTDDGTAAEQLYTDNMGLIRKICRKYAPYAEMDDLMQEAYFSLLEAAQHFEEGHGTKFSTYAVEAIRRGCIRYIQQSGRVIRIPAEMLRQLADLEKLRGYFQETAQREPTEKEIMCFLKLSRKQFLELFSAEKCSYVLSIDKPIKNDQEENLSLSDTIADGTNTEQEYIDRECRAELWQRVDDLPEMQRDIIRAHHQEKKSLERIAQDKGSTRDKIRQTEQKGLSALRRNPEVKEIAERYGYGIRQAYKWPLARFKDTWTSSTEWLALKRLEG